MARAVVTLQTATISVPPATVRNSGQGQSASQNSVTTDSQSQSSPSQSRLPQHPHSLQAQVAGGLAGSSKYYVAGMGNMVLQDEIRSVLTKQTKSSSGPTVASKSISKEESVLGGLKVSIPFFIWYCCFCILFIFLKFIIFFQNSSTSHLQWIKNWLVLLKYLPKS